MISFPGSWKFDEAKALCTELVDCINKTAPTVPYETPFKMIRTTNVKAGRVNLEEARFVDEATFIKWNRRLTPKYQDIVLTREAPLGDVGLIRNDENVFLGQRTMLFRADPEVLDQHFLYYTLLGPTAQAQIKTYGSGSTVEHMRVPDAEKITIPYPEPVVQRKIAGVLTAYDDLIETNKRRIALLEKMAEEIYREWFVRFRFPGHQDTKFVKGVPEDWLFERMGTLIDHYIGGGWGEDLQTIEFGEPAYVIRGTDIPRVQVGDTSSIPFRFHTSSNLSARVMRPNDFVFEASGGSKNQLLGRNVRISEVLLESFSEPVIPASFCKLIRFKPNRVSPYLMHLYLKLFYDQGLVGIFQVQSTSISNYQFESFLKFHKMLVPPEGLQKQFDQIVRPILDQKDQLGLENSLAIKTRDLLLPRLISGKLSVEDLDIQFPPSMLEESA